MSSPYIVLISGANRGLGKGLLELYLARPNHIVIGANRNPDHSTSKALFDLPKGEGSRLVVVKLDATVESDAADAMKELQSQGIDHLDTVIANAGAATSMPFVRDVTVAEIQATININVFGVVLLYQAALPLLEKAKSPKWVTMGSGAGSITAQPPIPNASYGASKSMVHWLTKRMNGEEPRLTAFVLHPG
jgi:norsolorinic acid ketoreductase